MPKIAEIRLFSIKFTIHRCGTVPKKRDSGAQKNQMDVLRKEFAQREMTNQSELRSSHSFRNVPLVSYLFPSYFQTSINNRSFIGV